MQSIGDMRVLEAVAGTGSIGIAAAAVAGTGIIGMAAVSDGYSMKDKIVDFCDELPVLYTVYRYIYIYNYS